MRFMNEKELTEIVQQKLQEKLGDYEVLISENLIYKVFIDDHLEYEPKNPKKPSRGNLSFQTDLMIKDNNIPLVVIEVKNNGFSTHDILIYSTKAQRHKEIYPYLRYGFLIGNLNVIHNRFFIHNYGFDFALAIENCEIENINKLIKIINSQIENAKKLLSILKKESKVTLFNTTLDIL